MLKHFTKAGHWEMRWSSHTRQRSQEISIFDGRRDEMRWGEKGKISFTLTAMSFCALNAMRAMKITSSQYTTTKTRWIETRRRCARHEVDERRMENCDWRGSCWVARNRLSIHFYVKYFRSLLKLLRHLNGSHTSHWLVHLIISINSSMAGIVDF